MINSNTIKSIDTNLKNAAVIRDGEIGLFSYQNISDIDDSTKAYGLLTTNSSGCFLTAGNNYDVVIGQLDSDGAPGDYFFRGNSNGS